MRDLVADATRLATAVRLGRYPELLESERGRCMACRSLERTRRFAALGDGWCSVPMCIGCVAKAWKRSRDEARRGRVDEEVMR